MRNFGMIYRRLKAIDRVKSGFQRVKTNVYKIFPVSLTEIRKNNTNKILAYALIL